MSKSLSTAILESIIYKLIIVNRVGEADADKSPAKNG